MFLASNKDTVVKNSYYRSILIEINWHLWNKEKKSSWTNSSKVGQWSGNIANSNRLWKIKLQSRSNKVEGFCMIDLFYFHEIITTNAQKIKFSIKDFLSKCDQISNFLWIWSHLMKKSLMEIFIFMQCTL